MNEHNRISKFFNESEETDHKLDIKGIDGLLLQYLANDYEYDFIICIGGKAVLSELDSRPQIVMATSTANLIIQSDAFNQAVVKAVEAFSNHLTDDGFFTLLSED